MSQKVYLSWWRVVPKSSLGRGGRSAYLKILGGVIYWVLIHWVILTDRVGEYKAVFAPNWYYKTSEGFMM